jgi:hypothetical protein
VLMTETYNRNAPCHRLHLFTLFLKSNGNIHSGQFLRSLLRNRKEDWAVFNRSDRENLFPQMAIAFQQTKSTRAASVLDFDPILRTTVLGLPKSDRTPKTVRYREKMQWKRVEITTPLRILQPYLSDVV